MEHCRLERDGVGGSEEDENFYSKSKFLNVKSFYESRDLKEGNNNDNDNNKDEEDGERKKRSRSNSSSGSSRRGEGSEVKRGRNSLDDQVSVNGVVRDNSVDLNDVVRDSVNAFVGVSFSLDNNNFFRIPKRPRGSARRKKIVKGSGVKEEVRGSIAVCSVAAVNHEVKKVEDCHVPMLLDSLVESVGDQRAGKLRRTSASNAAMLNAKRKTSSNVHKERENGIMSAENYEEKCVSYGICDDGTSAIKRRTNHTKRKVFSSGNRAIAEKVENSVGESGSLHTNSLNDDDDEENLKQNAARMLSSRFDPSCTVFSAKMRYSLSPDTNGFSYIIPCPHFRADQDINSPTASESTSVDNSSKVLRLRKQHSEKGFSRKRRHYYEIVPRGLDPHWVLNRRIKVFWPLDKSWYGGLVSDYDPERKLHHINYDDKDEEWVDLQGEKFKLLLLPDEVPGKEKLKPSVEAVVADKGNMSPKFDDNDSKMHNNLDSEPIIAWLSRSSRQVKQSPSSPLKKQKLLVPGTLTSHDNYAKGNGNMLVRHGSDASGGVTFCSSSLCDDNSRAENSKCSEVRKVVVYHRKKHRKNGGNLSSAETENINKISPRTPKVHANESSSLQTLKDHRSRIIGGSDREQILYLLDDNGSLQLSMRLLESARYRFNVCPSLLALHGKLFGREQSWLSNTLMLSHCGTIVSRWPVVALEMLIVDNIIGMRSFLFEGRLDHVSTFVFLILSVFNRRGEDCLFVESQLPVTSVRIRLSCNINPRKKLLFTFYNFAKLGSSKLYLGPEVNHRSLLTQQLPLSECTYDNIKAFEGLNYQRGAPCAGLAQLDLQRITKPYMVPIRRSRESCRSKVGCAAFRLAVIPGKLPPFSVSFAAAPTFFHDLHLKRLMRHGFACVTLVDDDSSEDTENDNLVDRPDLCRAISLPRKDMEINFPSNVGSLSGAASAGCLTNVLPLSEKDDMPARDVGVSTESSQGLPNAEVDITESSTLSVTNQKNATEEINVPEERELDDQHVQFVPALQPSIMKTNIPHVGFSGVSGISIEIPSFDRSPGEKTAMLRQPPDWNANMGYTQSLNHTAPKSLLEYNRSSINSSLQEHSPVWPDVNTNPVYDVLGKRPKKPRTQVQYTMSHGGNDLSSKQKVHKRSVPYKKIKRADDRRNSTGSRSSQRNLEFSACDANVLVTSGDKGWRDCGARVVIELADRNEWALSIRIYGVTKYSCKVNNPLQWSTNRYTHAMMWKGGKDWSLEFPDRRQWLIFKEIHEECHNRNIRAASVKHIPIPGVCLIEDNNERANNTPFVRHSTKYFKQVENDVEMAMNPLHVLYDMDSEDELWLSQNKRAVCSKNAICDEISDELFEKTMDMFEKVAYAEKRDHFTVDKIDELSIEVGSTSVVLLIYEHWLQKRQRNGISLIRHLQPPLWEQYQQQVDKWEQAVAKRNTSVASVCQERPVLKEKPPMFAFCLRPRGLENLNKGSKPRSHKKLSVSVHNHAHADAGRRVNGVNFGEERVLFSGNGLGSPDSSPLLQPSTRGGYSPRDASGFGCFTLGNDRSEWNHPSISHNNKRRKFVGGFPSTPPSVTSHNQRTIGKRNGIHHRTMDVAEWPSHQYYQPEVVPSHDIHLFDASNVQEFRLVDPSGAARRAQDVAKMKRERAHKLMHRADIAIHKAVVAIMTAEAMKVSSENPNRNEVSTENSNCNV